MFWHFETSARAAETMARAVAAEPPPSCRRSSPARAARRATSLEIRSDVFATLSRTGSFTSLMMKYMGMTMMRKTTRSPNSLQAAALNVSPVVCSPSSSCASYAKTYVGMTTQTQAMARPKTLSQ